MLLLSARFRSAQAVQPNSLLLWHYYYIIHYEIYFLILHSASAKYRAQLY